MELGRPPGTQDKNTVTIYTGRKNILTTFSPSLLSWWPTQGTPLSLVLRELFYFYLFLFIYVGQYLCGESMRAAHRSPVGCCSCHTLSRYRGQRGPGSPIRSLMFSKKAAEPLACSGPGRLGGGRGGCEAGDYSPDASAVCRLRELSMPLKVFTCAFSQYEANGEQYSYCRQM